MSTLVRKVTEQRPAAGFLKAERLRHRELRLGASSDRNVPAGKEQVQRLGSESPPEAF